MQELIETGSYCKAKSLDFSIFFGVFRGKNARFQGVGFAVFLGVNNKTYCISTLPFWHNVRLNVGQPQITVGTVVPTVILLFREKSVLTYTSLTALLQ